jgi:hypothetical protein
MQLAPLASTNRRKIKSFLTDGEALMTGIPLPSWTGMETAVNRMEMKRINAPICAADYRQAA